MSDLLPPVEYPGFLRVVEEPVKARKDPPKFRELPPNDHLTLVFDTETTTDLRQELRFGIAQVCADDRLLRTHVITGELTPTELARVQRWAADRGFEVLPVQLWVSREFLPTVVDQRAVIVGFNLPFDLARIAANHEPKIKTRNKRAWTLFMVGRSNPKCAYIPRIRVERVNSSISFISLTGTKGRFRNYRGAFVDAKTFVRALTGESHSLKSAGEALGCTRKKTEADYLGPVNARFLDYALNDVELTWEVHRKCLSRYAEFGLDVHPSKLYSGASLAKAIWKARGIVPPQLGPRWHGRLMAAFYAGKVECRVRGRDVEDVAVLDFTAQYPSLFCLLGAERYLTAERLAPRSNTKEIRSWVDSLTRGDLLRPETLRDPRMWTLCEVEAEGAVLPVRSTFDGKPTDAPTIGWNHTTTEPGLTLPYMLPDLLAAKLYGDGSFLIVRATTFEPVGQQQVNAIRVLGVEVGPEQGVIQALSEARIREKREKVKGWKHRADGLKTICNSGSYGIFVEVNRKQRATPVPLGVHGLGEEPFEAVEDEPEEPGNDYCPLVGTVLTSASHLLLALVDRVAGEFGGEVVYSDTDSAFVTPSRIAPNVSAAFADLNPYAEASKFLKDETEEKAPATERARLSSDPAPRFYGLSAKRYCLFVRGMDGRPHVFRTGKPAASDHALGAFQVGKDRRKWVADLWERIVEFGPGAAEFYLGEPATSEFSLATPNLLPRVRDLGPIRPFTFLTARLLEPRAGPEELRSELVPFVGKDDTARRAALMELPGQRSLGSVLEEFIAHRDRKYLFDREGRAFRRHVLVRRRNLTALGKEANRIEEARVLGLDVVRGRAKRYADADPYSGSATEVAKRLGVSRRTVFNLRRRATSILRQPTRPRAKS